MPRSELFPQVADGVRVLDPAVGPDTMAVVGAMMSRAPDLGLRFDKLEATSAPDVEALLEQTLDSFVWGGAATETSTALLSEQRALVRQILGEFLDRQDAAAWNFRNPPEKVRAFLAENVAGYNHASIASMGKSCFIYAHGFGWPAAWLLTDAMLFDGQEVSTRAVDATKIPGIHGPGTVCRFAPEQFQALHERWLAAYAVLRDQATGGGWKYDDARVYLPGSTPTGVVLTNDVRAIARQMDHIAGLGGLGEGLADMVYAGLDALAPVTTAAIGRKARRPQGNWGLGLHAVRGLTGETAPGAGVRLEQWDALPPGMTWERFLDRVTPRERSSTYMDVLWKQAPRFKLTIPCSIAIARDWHRHRPVMPWCLALCLEQDAGDRRAPRAGDRVAMAPWYRIGERVGGELLDETSRQFWGHLGARGEATLPASARLTEALHALPFGAMVELSCVATLPDLVYMLELRMLAKGANPEYKAQAKAALEQLCDLLPGAVVAAEHLDGGLKRLEAQEHPV